MAKFTRVQEFIGEGAYVRFIPVCNVPGYSHRVVIEACSNLHGNHKYLAQGWLSKGTRITESVVQYYLDKHTVMDANGRRARTTTR